MQRTTRRCTWPPSELLAMARRALHCTCALQPAAVHGLASCGTRSMRLLCGQCGLLSTGLSIWFHLQVRPHRCDGSPAAPRRQDWRQEQAGAVKLPTPGQRPCGPQVANHAGRLACLACLTAACSGSKWEHSTACMGVFSACCLLAHLVLAGADRDGLCPGGRPRGGRQAAAGVSAAHETVLACTPGPVASLHLLHVALWGHPTAPTKPAMHLCGFDMPHCITPPALFCTCAQVGRQPGRPAPRLQPAAPGCGRGRTGLCHLSAGERCRCQR